LTYRVRSFSAIANAALLIVGNPGTGQWYEQWIDANAKTLVEETLKKGQTKDPQADPASPQLFPPDLLPRITLDLHVQVMRVVARYKKLAAGRVLEALRLRSISSRDNEDPGRDAGPSSTAVESPPQGNVQASEHDKAISGSIGTASEEPTTVGAGDDKTIPTTNVTVVAGEAGTDKADPDRLGRATARADWIDRRLAQHSTWTSDTDITANGGPSYNTIRRYRSGARSTRDLYVRRQLAMAFQCAVADVPE
jgi:hypothetical protein